MKENILGVSDGAPTQEPSETTTNMSLDQWSQHRVRSKLGEPAEEPKEETAEKPNETEEPAEELLEKAESEPTEESEEGGIEETEDAESEVESVLSKLNLDDLSTEEVDQLRDALRSKALARYGELTAKRKAAEERAQQLEQQLQELKQNKNPLEDTKPVENNPFSDIEDIAGLQEQFTEFTRIQEWAEDLLDESEHYGFDDVITEVDGKELTKKAVKDYLKKARKAKETYLPARLKELQEEAQREQVSKVLEEQTAKEISWFADEENDTRRQLDMVLEDPAIKKIKKSVPEIAPRLTYILAHAINSITQTKAPAKPATTNKVKPPSNPTSSIARGIERDDTKIKKQLSELQNRFVSNGNKDDFIALRTAQRRLQTK